MKPFWVCLRKEWWEQWRTHRLLVAVAVLAVFGLASPLLAKFTPEFVRLLPNGDALAAQLPAATALDAVAQYVKNLSQFGVILAVLLGMGGVVQERERGTAALVLVKPLSRHAFLFAKFAALGAVFALAVALAGAGCLWYTRLLFAPLDPLDWLSLNALMLVFLLVHAALTLCCSVLARSQAAAGGAAFGLSLLLALGGSLPVVGRVFPVQLLNWGAALMAGEHAPAWPALGASAGLVALSLVGAWRLFARQEL